MIPPPSQFSRASRLRRPHYRNSAHWVSSPNVTNVTHGCLPTRRVKTGETPHGVCCQAEGPEIFSDHDSAGMPRRPDQRSCSSERVSGVDPEPFFDLREPTGSHLAYRTAPADADTSAVCSAVVARLTSGMAGPVGHCAGWRQQTARPRPGAMRVCLVVAVKPGLWLSRRVRTRPTQAACAWRIRPICTDARQGDASICRWRNSW